jgi:hypothetical protein
MSEPTTDLVARLLAERDAARADAERLAEALRWTMGILTQTNARLPHEILAGPYGEDVEHARAALAAHDGAAP